MKTISAHVTGFYRSSFHAYTTEVSVDDHRWRLGLRYSKFHDFYDQLVLRETGFHFAFPPKGTLFFTPKPEQRQEQLEEFLQQVLAYYAAKGYPVELEQLLCELLKVPRHLKSPEHEDDDVSTSTESVLDEPMHEPSTESLAVEKPLQEETVEEEELPEVVALAEQLVSEEPNSVEEAPAVHEDAETQVETVSETPAEEAEVAKEALEEDLAPMIEEEEAATEVPVATAEVPVEEVARENAVTEEAAKEEEEAVETRPEEHVEVAPEVQQAVVEPDVKIEKPVVPESLAVTESVVAAKEEKEEDEKLATSGGDSSWVAAYLPKSLLGFIRRRCLKKTNLVMLCVALLLPMVLARR